VKRAGGMAQIEGHLPSKYETLSSNPNTAKKKKSNVLFNELVWSENPCYK
jgi:hypothetical protein